MSKAKDIAKTSGTNTGDQTPTSLSLVIGTNVQAYDADLTTWAGVTPGTGVATALAIAVGTSGAPVTNGGELGTPSGGTLSNCTFPTLNQDTSGIASKSTNLVGGNATTLLGAIPYQSGTDTTTQLAPNTTTTKKFLRETGNGTNGAAPAWDTIVIGDLPTITPSKGGTGVDQASALSTLTISGAFGTTLTVSATTALTLPTSGTLATTSQITGTNSGTNTGDNAVNSNYSGLVTNATHTGDATGATGLTVKGINGTLLSSLGTGILKNTTTTGVPSIAIASDFPTLNQDTSGTAAKATNIAGGVAGGIPYQTGDGATSITAASTAAGQVLTTVTAGAAPTWETPAAGGGGTSLGVSFAIYNNMNIF